MKEIKKKNLFKFLQEKGNGMVFIGTTQSKASRYFQLTAYVFAFFFSWVYFFFFLYFYFEPNFYLAYFIFLGILRNIKNI